MGWRSKRSHEGTATGQIENLIGRSARVQGDLKADGAFRIDGVVEGSIETKAAVVLGQTGTVHGNIRGSEVVIAGTVIGNVTCAGHIEIVATGKVEGDIEAASVRIETGGIFRGTSHMGGQDKAIGAADAAREAVRLTSVG